MRYVALLRGINVGGKNKLPMTDLAKMFEESGCGDVKTYIQSGNVVFSADPKVVERLPQTIAEDIREEFGLEVPVVLRSAKELDQIVRKNPFLAAGGDPQALHVMFLADKPDNRAVDTLDLNRSPPDEFTVMGKDIFLSCPNGVARTKLTNDWFDRKLGTVSTGRNWRTVLKLHELSRAG
jgi:uncharacterized protein (DUF1697 family)